LGRIAEIYRPPAMHAMPAGAVVLRFAAVPRPPTTDLPARDLAEIRVAERLTGPGCPFCAWRSTAEERGIDALIGEAVTDPGVRRRIERAGGFCARHSALLPVRERDRRGGTMGTAVLLGAVLGSRLAALDEAAEGGSRRLKGRIESLAAAPACPICADVGASVSGAMAIVIARLGDPAWVDATGSAAFCWPDMIVLWTAVARAGGRTVDAWRPVAARQSARLRDALRTAEAYVAHSAFDRRDELTDEEREAADVLAALLAGRPTT
jgi:hypothetical protein